MCAYVYDGMCTDVCACVRFRSANTNASLGWSLARTMARHACATSVGAHVPSGETRWSALPRPTATGSDKGAASAAQARSTIVNSAQFSDFGSKYYCIGVALCGGRRSNAACALDRRSPFSVVKDCVGRCLGFAAFSRFCICVDAL